MEFKDYYAIMGVDPQATPEEIKRTYRKLARKYHPDVSQEAQAEEKFKALGEAYEVLKDPAKRATYDKFRAQGFKGGEQFTPPHGQQGTYHHINPEEASAFSDFFESLFGGAYRTSDINGANFRPGRTTRGEDLYYSFEIDLQDAYHGATKKIEVPSSKAYQGKASPRKSIQVKIPQGVVDGQQIRLKGQGGPGYSNGPSGDLYLEVHFKPSALYHVSGRDVILYLPVTPWEAALGSRVKAPTLGGIIEVKIPENSQTGAKLRLKGRGLPGKHPGDQYVILQIVTPPIENEETRHLYQEMADKITFNPREKLGA